MDKLDLFHTLIQTYLISDKHDKHSNILRLRRLKLLAVEFDLKINTIRKYTKRNPKEKNLDNFIKILQKLVYNKKTSDVFLVITVREYGSNEHNNIDSFFDNILILTEDEKEETIKRLNISDYIVNSKTTSGIMRIDFDFHYLPIAEVEKKGVIRTEDFITQYYLSYYEKKESQDFINGCLVRVILNNTKFNLYKEPWFPKEELYKILFEKKIINTNRYYKNWKGLIE